MELPNKIAILLGRSGRAMRNESLEMTEATAEKRRPNRLAKEKSPYLIKHAYNPVDWYPWGEEAFLRAKNEDKPIFLSIGYSTCHWCTVMEHESFENERIAKILNDNFVSIKVDREELPDIDNIYMKAVSALTGQGGWPLSVFLTPNLKPFYGGTYFPPESRYGLPSFPQVLGFIADLWKNKKEEIVRDSDGLIAALQRGNESKPRDALPKSILDGAYAQIISALDEQHGGFSEAPKFPLPSYMEFLLRYYRRTKKEPALRGVKKTLQSMTAGGIHDQLGGGFHRYSTDRFWLVPHFEKMLYDNAQLARVNLEAYQLTGDPSFLDTARKTLAWMLREMKSPEGGFYSAQDADTPDGEGYYYTWTPSEISKVLGTDSPSSKFICELFDITSEGNFEGGRSILHVKSSLERIASKYGLQLSEAERLVDDAKRELLTAREKRVRPATDDKVLTSWNGLAISALLSAYQVTGEESYLGAARSASEFVLSNLVKEGKLLRRFRAGESAFDGGLEDYAFMAAALMDMYESTFEARWLKEGIKLSDKMVELFWDNDDPKLSGAFKSSSAEFLIKVKEGYDGPTPSGNSVAALTLLRLSALTGEEEYRSKAEVTLKFFGDDMESSPFSHTYMMCALDFWFGSREIVVADGSDAQFGAMVTEIRRRFLPDKVLASSGGDTPDEVSFLTLGKNSLKGKSTVYICQNFACQSPITEIGSLVRELDS